MNNIVRRATLRFAVAALLAALGLSASVPAAHAGIPGKCVDVHEPAVGNGTVCTP